MNITASEMEKMKQKSQRSVLWEYHDEIIQMRNENISFRIIMGWLQKQGIHTSVQNIRQFYLRNLNTQVNIKKKAEKPKKKVGTVFANLQQKDF